MYQIKCDDYILYDARDESLVVTSPKLTLETNTAGKGSFTIHSGHPYYDCLSKLKSVFTITEDGQAIFRGRMTDDSKDWNVSKRVELEGALAYFNDSIIEPFAFPEGFAGNADYITAAASGNVVQFFLNWLIAKHNSQVESYQEFKLGNVTVADVNNYISRSSEEYSSTWAVISDKLFKTNLGGKLCIRYEADGNYIDYLSEFAATNSQTIEFGENLLDLVTDSSAIDTYSAILPIGKDGLTIESIADGDLTSDLVKAGKVIYSKSAKTSYGYICKTIKWDDVTEAVNLKTKAQSLLSGIGVKLANTITVKAVDLHCTDAQIASFRINKKVTVNSAPHGYSGAFDLTKLDIDILSPENTTFTLGETVLTLADINAKDRRENTERTEKVTRDIANINTAMTETEGDVSALTQRVTTAESSITQNANNIALKVSKTELTEKNYVQNNVPFTTPLNTSGSAGGPLGDAVITGASVQAGAPTPEVPIAIQNTGSELKLVSAGKNLIPYPYAENTKTINGITFTVQNDGGINIKGTATNNVTITLANKIANFGQGTYTYKLNNGVAGVQTILEKCNGNTWIGNIINVYGNTSATVNISAEDAKYSLTLYIRVVSGTTVDVTVYPQIERESSATSYEAYKGKVYTIPLKDVNGNNIVLTKCDKVEKRNGIWGVAKNGYIKTFNGTEDFGMITSNSVNRFILSIPNLKPNTIALCSHFPYMQNGVSTLNIFWVSTSMPSVAFTHSSIDVNAFKSWLAAQNTAGTPVTVQYQTSAETWVPLSTEAASLLDSIVLQKPNTNLYFSNAVLPVMAGKYNVWVYVTKFEKTVLESSIEQNAANIALKVSKNNIISEINQTAEEVKIAAGKIALEGYTTINGNFAVDTNGNVSVTGNITATTLNVTAWGTIAQLSADNIFGGDLHIDNNMYIMKAATIISGIYWAESEKDIVTGTPNITGWTSQNALFVGADKLHCMGVTSGTFGSSQGDASFKGETSTSLGSINSGTNIQGKDSVKLYAFNVADTSNPHLIEAEFALYSNSDTGSYRPIDGTVYLGDATYKWESLYANTGAIQTSDRNKKNSINYDMTAYEALFPLLKPCSYKMNDGTSDRTHSGFISQDFEEAMAVLNMDNKAFAAFIKSPRYVKDEDGNPTETIDGYDYAIRYEELIAINTHMIQKLINTVNELEEQVNGQININAD